MSTELTAAELTQLREQVDKLREENKRMRDGIVIVDCCPACLLKGAKIAELEATVAALEDQRRDFPRVCHWSEDDDGIWNGSCGVAWFFEYATTPKENGMNHCPKCGAVLMQKETE